MPKSLRVGLLLTAAVSQLVSFNALGAQPNRIVARIDNNNRVRLSGHIHPRALAGVDQGRVEASRPLQYVTITLKPSAAQQADLEQLLAEQQDPASPNYHRWLTPEQYGDRFGASQADLNQVVNWLQQQQLTVVGTARGRNWVAFSGTAGQVENAFQTQIHYYLAEDGTQHYANSTEPSIPAALAPVVSQIHGLTDFRLRAPKRQVRPGPASQPQYTSSHGNHYLAPDDIATIYNLQPLYGAGVDGTGQSIVVVGQTQINLSDIDQFRSAFNLPGSDPQVMLVPNSRDPGISQNDLIEADLDLEWSGAVARKASLIYVYSYDVMTAVQYAIDQNLAPVMSMSYGSCEAQTPSSDAQSMQSWAQQANAQGMTWLAASGDSGAGDCVGGGGRTGYGLQVDMPASLPQVTGIGGTEFNEGGGTYWGSNNANQASVLSYVPETAWNDSAIDGSPSASGGGASTFFAKPSWQSGAGVPNDGARDVPDVSVSASADHDGYLVYSAGQQVVGGTSVGAPSFAGIMALLNHYLLSTGAQGAAGVGNINPRLYSLAQTNASAFHDITSGDNIVNPCPARARNCTPTPVGFSAGPGYDQVTGLGSVDVSALIEAWHVGGPAIKSNAALAISANVASITTADSTILTATVKSTSGVTPGGTVTFLSGSATLGSAALAGSGGTATASLTLSGTQLAVGTDTITAQYSGDNLFNNATASVAVNVSAIGATGPPSITAAANAASFRQVYAPGEIVAVFGTQLAPAVESAAVLPLPKELAGASAVVNGVTAPLYYVAPGQLNIQIPYETPVNSSVLLTVNNNGQTSSTTLHIAPVAPGIFINTSGAPVPTTSAAHGDVAVLYITGDGALSPQLATGTAPAAGTAIANLPKPLQGATVTVGGVTADIQFIGIPPGLVGATQINYTIPAGAPTGAQPVVVTVGGVVTPPATLTVTP